LRIIFFGTPTFAAHILDYLLDHGQEIIGIVTRPDKPKGRSNRPTPSAVKSLAQEKCPQIPLFQPEKASTEETAAALKALKPDVFVVASYGEIIKTNLLEIPTKMCVNVHPSLLPKYRGATPIHSAILNGDTETGVTIMEMVLKMDAGDILDVVKTHVSEDMTFGELEEILWDLSGPVLVKVLEKIELGTIQKVPQDHTQVTFAKKILPEDRLIDWKKGAVALYDQIRALSPKPGAFCFVEVEGETKRLVIKKTKKVLNMTGQPGESLVYQKDCWIIACGSGALSLLEVQLEGKKPLPIQEFIRGVFTPPLIKS